LVDESFFGKAFAIVFYWWLLFNESVQLNFPLVKDAGNLNFIVQIIVIEVCEKYKLLALGKR